MPMSEHAIVIAGGGPTGMMLAGELALAGVDVAIVERRTSQELEGSRSGGLHARTIEILDQRGIADRFLSKGQVVQVTGFAGIRLDISDFPTRHPYGLGLWQKHIERILAGWVEELAVPVYRGCEVTGFAQDDTGVDVGLSEGPSLRAKYLVGCDGGRSLIRKAAGIDVSRMGSDHQPPDCRGRNVRRAGMGHPSRRLRHPSFGREDYEIRNGEVVYSDTGPVRVMVTERSPDAPTNPPFAISARCLSPCTGPITGSTVPPGSPDLPI